MIIKVEAYHDGRFWCGRGIGADFFTQGKTLDELMRNVKEAASLHFDDVLKRGQALNLLLISDRGPRRRSPSERRGWRHSCTASKSAGKDDNEEAEALP